MIFIKSRREGFRRCNVRHTAEGQLFDDDAFTDEEIDRLENEPMLDMRYEPKPEEPEPESELEPEPEMTPEPEPDSEPEPEPEQVGDELQALIDAGKKAIEDGNVIGSGAPSVEAMEDILGFNIIAAQRDVAWQAIQEENK